MCTATIEFISPDGIPISLQVNAEDDQQTIVDTLDRAAKIGAHLAARGWAFGSPPPIGSVNAPTHSGPSFAGYPCSPTVDERGLPTWIVVDGRQALRREKQGDVWYSVKQADGNYMQVLRIPRGERLPEPVE